MKKLILILLAIPVVWVSYAQTYLNTGFEHGVYKDQPRKWSIEGEGNFNAELVETQKHEGQKSLHIHLDNAQAYTFLSLPKETIAGKKVQVAVYVRSTNPASLQIMAAFKDPSGKPVVTPLKGLTADSWTVLSQEATFQANYASDRLLVAFITAGSGDLWLDDVTIRIDGELFGNAAPDFAEPTAATLKVLNAHAIPLSGVDPGSIHDLKALKPLVSGAGLVALGENSHGSASLFRLKLKLLKYLVQEAGFTVFVLESPAVEADKINDYVMNNTGTQADVLKSLVYPSWQNADMLGIIEWIKAYNSGTKAKVSFRGVDVQDGWPSLRSLQEFAAKYDAGMNGRLQALTAEYEDALKKKDFGQALMLATALDTDLQSKTGSSYGTVSADELMRVKRYANVLLLHIRLKSGVADRDFYMAESLKWLAEQYKGEKIVFSGDNSHVTRASGKMGSYLSATYGKKYLVIGATYNAGSYSAYGDKEFYEVHPSYAGTYEYIFSKSRHKHFLLDIQNTEVKQALPSISGFRSIGSRPQETTQFSELVLTEHFDIIAYTEHSEHTPKK